MKLWFSPSSGGPKWLATRLYLSYFFALSFASVVKKRSTEVSLISYTFSNNVLAGSISIENIAYTKVVTVTYAVGDDWSSSAISASYSSGPGSDGYETWTFSGTATGATQFYITYTVSGSTYYDPGNYVNYQISGSATTTGSSSYPTTIPTSDTLVEWLAAESPIADAALKRNIGSSSNTLIPTGVVIASPATSSPDYYYQWTRDASTVVAYLIDEYVENGDNLDYILEWVANQYIIQRIDNPSGGFRTGGLGEPKFNVDDTAYTGSWGRPQRDGPALRASALIKFAKSYISVNESYVTSTLYDSLTTTNSVIKADLDYVVTYWSSSGYDLWEERNSVHFFTLMVSYRAMIEGAELATLLGDTTTAATYTSTAASMVSTINNFWSSSKGFITATTNDGRSSIDCGTLLGSIHGGGYLFPPSNNQVLATVNALIAAFESLYTINTASGAVGVAIGRYPEDVYDGVSSSSGNPWFICTATVAHTLYAAVSDFQTAGSLTVDSTNLALFQRTTSGITAGTYANSSTTFTTLMSNTITYADTFLSVVQKYAATNGSLHEEFSRSTGALTGARDLTWSYESILGAINQRLNVA
ncbi:glycoside hydrolase 15 protein [Rhizina undulata]